MTPDKGMKCRCPALKAEIQDLRLRLAGTWNQADLHGLIADLRKQLRHQMGRNDRLVEHLRELVKETKKELKKSS